MEDHKRCLWSTTNSDNTDVPDTVCFGQQQAYSDATVHRIVDLVHYAAVAAGSVDVPVVQVDTEIGVAVHAVVDALDVLDDTLVGALLSHLPVSRSAGRPR